MSIIKNLPDNFNILSPVAFRFETRKIPNVTYFIQTANIPGMSTSEFLRETPFKAIPTVGDTLEVETLDITFVVDEDLANYQEIINWLKGMTSPENFDNVMPNMYSDATLTILTNNMNANKLITFYDIFPTSLSAISLESNVDDISPITADVSFQIRDYSIDKL